MRREGVARLRAEDGFSLAELLVAMAIAGLIMGAIAAALIVEMRTSEQTVSRLNEAHDVQISSAYLARDIQSAERVVVPGGSGCGSMAPLVDFVYGGATVSYCWGPDGAGQARVVRIRGDTTITIARFAHPVARPAVTCSPHGSCADAPDVVQISFPQASGNVFNLLGSRRMQPVDRGGEGSGVGEPPPLTLLATGSVGNNSPLWVLGGCKGGGVNSDCIETDPSNGMPVADLVTTGWSPTPLWERLSDASDETFVQNAPGSTAEARVALEPVQPPASSDPYVAISVRALALWRDTPVEKLKVTLYQRRGSTLSSVASYSFNVERTIPTDNVYTLTNPERGKISDYGNLVLGFSMSQGATDESIRIFGVALDTIPPQDTTALYGDPVLVVNGNLYVNSTRNDAVRLTGTKKKVKLQINGPSEPFRILQPGECSGCTPKTVVCPNCDWSDGRIWQWFSPRIVDPLRFMSAPTDAGVHTHSSCPAGSTWYSPGVYTTQLRIAAGAKACLDGGIYILKQGMKVEGNATVVGQRVMLYNEGGSITFGGGSNVQLTAYDSYPYRNILIFQARCPGDDPMGCPSYNANKIELNGGALVGGAGESTMLGIVYAPASEDVTLGTGGAYLRVTAVIAQNITVTGNSRVTIG